MARDPLSPSSDDSLLLRALDILRRRRVLALAIFGAVLASAVAFALYLPDLYKASALVLVERPVGQLSKGMTQKLGLLGCFLTRRDLYVLDEPSVGLHAADVHNLTDVLQKFADDGHTVLIIEHNMDIIKLADHIIDLGPEGGDRGGFIVAEGTPEEVAKVKESYTGQYLKKHLRNGRK